MRMGLDRDELAARNMAALLSNPSGPVQANPSSGWGLTNCTPDDVAALAVSLTDALIARLRPATVAPVADAAPTDPRRTVGAVVRDEDSEYAVILSGDGQAQRPLHLDATTDPRWFALDDDEFVRWATRDECERHGIPYVARGRAPSPAASPAAYVPTPAKSGAAAYVPQVGDVVNTLDSGEALGFDATVVSERDAKGAYLVHYHDRPSGDKIRAFGEPRYLRPATAAERAAAGLPPITPDHPQGGQGAEAEGRVGDQRVAAGLDAPAFDEASERETAVDIAKDRGLDVAEEVGFVAGWLARARIAANGGVA